VILVEISSRETMKPIIVVAILLLSLFLIPMALAMQQSVQNPKTMLSGPTFDSGFILCVAITKPNDPGSGGGGQGVIK
jgi:hypothetical protein